MIQTVNVTQKCTCCVDGSANSWWRILSHLSWNLILKGSAVPIVYCDLCVLFYITCLLDYFRTEPFPQTCRLVECLDLFQFCHETDCNLKCWVSPVQVSTSPQPVPHCNQLRTTVSRQLTTVSDQSLISLQTTMFLLLRLLALPLLCIEAMNVQDAFAGDGLVNDLKIPAPKKQLEVMINCCSWLMWGICGHGESCPGCLSWTFPSFPWRHLGSERGKPESKRKTGGGLQGQALYCWLVHIAILHFFTNISQPWSTQMRHPGKTLGLLSGSTG